MQYRYVAPSALRAAPPMGSRDVPPLNLIALLRKEAARVSKEGPVISYPQKRLDTAFKGVQTTFIKGEKRTIPACAML